MAQALPNYLRTYRKRSGFTQDEMASLLGSKSGTKVSRYERNARYPNLETVFAYEVIFQTPARELFPGIYQQVESETIERIHFLRQKLNQKQSNPVSTRKVETLQKLLSRKHL